MWTKINELLEECNSNILGFNNDDACWMQAYHEFKKILLEERNKDSHYAPTIFMLDEITDDEFGFIIFFDDLLEILEDLKLYDDYINVCDDLVTLFKEDLSFANDMMFNKSYLLLKMGKVDEAVRYCERWVENQPNNIRPSTALVYTLIESKRYDDALVIIKQYIDDFNNINEDNEIMFYALARLYKVLNKNKELRLLNKVIKEYQDHVDELMLQELYDDEDYCL